MKIKITKKGVYLAVNGVEQMLEVGAVLDFDVEPLWAVNKYEVVAESTDEKTLVVAESTDRKKKH